MNRNKMFFENVINIINSQIKLLRDAGIEIHDSNDFDFVIDHVRYSEASDTVSVSFREMEFQDDYCRLEFQKEQETEAKQSKQKL